MERFQLLKPVFSTSFPDKLRKTIAFTAALRQQLKETTAQAQELMHNATTHVSYAAQDTTLVLMRTGLHVATDLQRFFLADISVYSCLQFTANLIRQIVTVLKK